VPLVESEKYFLTLVHAESTRGGRPRVGSGISCLTAQHHANALAGHDHFLRNDRNREAPMPKPKRQLTLFVGQVGGHLNLLGE
jgi:hypothetical protein